MTISKETETTANLSPKRYELICVVLVSLACFCLLCGYDTQSTLVEPVLQSVSRQKPDINPHAGYYGQSVLCGVYVVANLFSPWVVHKVGSKLTLVFGAACFLFYNLAFLALNSIIYYVASAIMGIGMAFYFSGQGLYLSEHSTSETLSRNAGIVGAISSAGTLFGGIILYIIFSTSNAGAASDISLENATNLNITHGYRSFSYTEINAIWGTISALALAGLIIYALLPSKQFNSIEQNTTIKTPTFGSQLSLAFKTMVNRRILMLVPFFMWYGFYISFWLVAVPTSFAFTFETSSRPTLLAFYMFAAGSGSVVGGFYISYFSSRNKAFGLTPCFSTVFVLSFIAYAIVGISTPNLATVHVTKEPALLFMPSIYTCVALGLLHGFIDCLVAAARTVICTLVVPHMRHQVNSVAKVYQSAASCLIFFLGPHLTIYRWIATLSVSISAAFIGFVYTSREINGNKTAINRERSHNVQDLS